MSTPPVYITAPARERAPAIVVLPPIFGLEPAILQLADRYAQRGFLTLAVNQFWREPETRVMGRDAVERPRALERAGKVDVERIIDDVGIVIDRARAHEGCDGRVAVLGICFGGRYAFMSAARHRIGAAGAFHGTQIGLELDEGPRVACPLSFHFGALDIQTPPDEIAAIRRVTAHRADAEIVVHDGADHNFAVPGHPAFNPDIAARAERAVLALFAAMPAYR